MYEKIQISVTKRYGKCDCWNKIKDKVEDLSKSGRNNKRDNQCN